MDDELDVAQYASPVGVVFAMAPVTEPVSTYVNKVLIALKGRNALILSPHRASAATAAVADDLVQAVLRRHGAPPLIVQLVRDRGSRQRTARFMRHRDVSLIVATGGDAMVRAAYSSGTPALGVGAGNAPVLVGPDADRRLRRRVRGREQELRQRPHLRRRTAPRRRRRPRRASRPGVARTRTRSVLDRTATEAFVSKAFLDSGRLRAAFIGRSAAEIAVGDGCGGPRRDEAARHHRRRR